MTSYLIVAVALTIFTYLLFILTYLRDHVATDLNIFCTVFPDVFLRFRGEPPMCFEPF